MSLQLFGIFKDNMILQRDKDISVFGIIDDSREVTSSLLSDAGEVISTATTQANANNKFVIKMPAVGAGGPYTLQVKAGRSSKTIKNVYVGEVWLAGGQSNMEMPIIRSENSEAVIKACKENRIHYYEVPVADTLNEEQAKAEEKSKWEHVTKRTLPKMSAIGYYFASILEKELDVHIGIIECYCGGTSISCWQSKEALMVTPEGRKYYEEYEDNCALYTPGQYLKAKIEFNVADKEYWDKVDEFLKDHPYATSGEIHEAFGDSPWPPPWGKDSRRRPNALYDAMVTRIMPYSIRGIIFYQGEDDCENHSLDYDAVFGSLIRDWRDSFEDKDIPFIFAQLAGYISKDRKYMNYDDLTWPMLRMMQDKVAKNMPNTYMITLIDAGEFDNVHPVDKKTPGTRMANKALRYVYGIEGIPTDGPRCIDVVRGEGGLELTFVGDFDMLHVMGAFEGDYGFQIADDSEVYVNANASVDFDGKTVILKCPMVEYPMTVRYAYFSYGNAGLRGSNGLPAAPFVMRVDNSLGSNR